MLVTLTAFFGLIGFSAAAWLIGLVPYGTHLARICFQASAARLTKTGDEYHYNKQKR